MSHVLVALSRVFEIFILLIDIFLCCQEPHGQVPVRAHGLVVLCVFLVGFSHLS